MRIKINRTQSKYIDGSDRKPPQPIYSPPPREVIELRNEILSGIGDPELDPEMPVMIDHSHYYHPRGL